MRKLLVFVAVASLLAAAVPAAAQAAKGVPYKGKTTGGHPITFKYSKGKMHNVKTGVPMTCISIQGGGSPVTGADLWTAGWLKVGLRDHKVTETSPTALHYRDVTKNHTINTRRGRNGAITGSIRVQFSFLIPKYPIGTFSIYSCLGSMKFKATPRR
ncbi:MAG TPA: hypothetical protein VHG69_02670 [Thermoleophilaceae bacterium]|nr:hypothetical protein [Thermoleophilaceae bacterium]